MRSATIIGKACFLLGLVLWSGSVVAITFTTIDHPSAGSGVNQGTNLMAVDGGKVVGSYSTSFGGNMHAFVYDGTTFTDLYGPMGSLETQAFGIEGDNIVGQYNNGPMHGFLYDGSTYTTIDAPSVEVNCQAYGISGDKIVGFYQDSNYAVHGFLYDRSGFSTIDHPLALARVSGYGTRASGIDGNNIVGIYEASDKVHGFLYDGTNFQNIDGPSGTHEICVYGIQGNKIVGSYELDGMYHGFIYDGVDYTTIDCPLGQGDRGTAITGIDGDTIVGIYEDSASVFHGFVAIVPEPSAFVLLGMGTACFVACLRRRGAKNMR